MKPMRPLALAGRGIAAVARGDTTTHRHLRERLVAMLMLSLVVDAVCGVLAFVSEHNAPKSDITDLGSALFFSSAQLLTVSSSMTNPLTTPGRLLDIGMEAYAITVVAALAGSFGAFFHRRSGEREKDEAAGAPG